MSYDLKAFSLDLQDRLNWLFKEVDRLHDENERLLQENKTLREEVTLARLFRDLEPVAAGPHTPALPDDLLGPPVTISREAMEFYHRLPLSFNFAEYFQAADAGNISSDRARDFMLVFFREHMLRQQGTRIEKTGTMPYPKRLAR